MTRSSWVRVVPFLPVTLAIGLIVVSAPPADAAEQASKAGNATQGATLWVNNCARCHNIRDPRELRDDQWKPVVTHMRIRCGLTGREARDILAFLQASN